MIKKILLAGLGGFLGSALRYLTYLTIDKRFETAFPWSTFVVNGIGSLLLGMIVAASFKGILSEPARLVLAVGFCGSFTTFSTFAMENFNLLSQKEPAVSLIYIFVSIVTGIGSFWLGQWLVR